MANLGIHVLEQATAVSIPVVADSGLPYVTGVAPIHMATKPGKVNTPWAFPMTGRPIPSVSSSIRTSSCSAASR